MAQTPDNTPHDAVPQVPTEPASVDIPVQTGEEPMPTTLAAPQQATSPTPKQQPSAQAFLRDSTGKPLFPALHRMRLEGNQMMNQSSQQMATAFKKTTGNVSEQVTSAFQQTQSTVSTAFTKSQTAIRSAMKSLKAGSSVKTAYGVGKVVSYDETSGMFRIQLSFGSLFTLTVSETTPAKKPATTLELNSAYESWEQTRRQLVQEECQKLDLPFTENTMHTCFCCLKEPAAKAKPTLADASGKPMFPMLYKLRQSGQDAVTNARKSESPCLLCAAVTCNRHSSEGFRKEGISVCQDCVKWLEYDFATARLPEDVASYVEHLVDLYQRAHLLLQYCTQFMLATAESLEQTTKQHNHIGVGGSSAGLVSGVLGVAAACSILTPAGPPLLVASLVFGGSATAVQTGSEACKYYGEPNQFANRILTLQGIAERILEMVKTMRDSTLLPYLAKATSKENEKADIYTGHVASNDLTSAITKESAAKVGVKIGSNAATSASLVAQEAALTGRFVSRATTAAARTARFARFAGGALSAATLVLEAREMHKTLDQIKLGSPCEKAEALRTVHANLNNMPSTVYVKNMCESYSKVRSKELFKAAFAETTSAADSLAAPIVNTDVDNELNGFTEIEDGDWVLAEEVVAGMEAAQESLSSSDASTTEDRISKRSKPSLLERVTRFKQRETEKGR